MKPAADTSEVAFGHTAGREPLFERFANATSIEFLYPKQRPQGFGFVCNNKPGYAIIDDLRHRPAVECNDRRAAGHCLDHDKSERFRPIDRKEQRRGVAEKFFLLTVVHFPNKSDIAAIDKRFNPLLEIVCFSPRY